MIDDRFEAEQAACIARVIDERNELMRRACLSAIARAESSPADVVDRRYLEWARDFVRMTPPLGRALGTGEPR